MPPFDTAPDALTFIRNEHESIARAVDTLKRVAGSAQRSEVEGIAADAALRLDVQEELEEQILYPAASSVDPRFASDIERMKLLHALNRVLLDDLRLEASDPYWSQVLADELSSVFARYAAEHAALLARIEPAATDRSSGIARRLAELRDRLLAVAAQPSFRDLAPHPA